MPVYTGIYIISEIIWKRLNDLGIQDQELYYELVEEILGKQKLPLNLHPLTALLPARA